MAEVQLTAATGTKGPAATFASFREFVEQLVLPQHAAHPADLRLDGQPTGGNREVAAVFWHVGRRWKVHSDTHYDRLLAAYDALSAGVKDPFIERPTPRGNSLDLSDALRHQSRDPGRKYIYIYEL